MTLKNPISLFSKNKQTNFQDKLNELLGTFFDDTVISPNTTFFNQLPAVDVLENDNDFTIKAELPSMNEDDIKLHVRKHHIYITGEKKDSTERNDNNYYISEIRYGKFSRDINLPFDIDTNKISAKFANGVLTINVEKPKGLNEGLQSINISSG